MSKVHTLGHTYLDKETHGLSLRFPRFIRRREDKSFKLPLQFFLDAASTEGNEEVDYEIGTSVEEILQMYDHTRFPPGK